MDQIVYFKFQNFFFVSRLYPMGRKNIAIQKSIYMTTWQEDHLFVAFASRKISMTAWIDILNIVDYFQLVIGEISIIFTNLEPSQIESHRVSNHPEISSHLTSLPEWISCHSCSLSNFWNHMDNMMHGFIYHYK